MSTDLFILTEQKKKSINIPEIKKGKLAEFKCKSTVVVGQIIVMSKMLIKGLNWH